MPPIDAFILIGGRSSRLGTDKAFVELGGETLAERSIANIRSGLSTAERITMVAGNSTQFATEAITTDIPFIFDLHEGRGPLGGIHAGLCYAKTAWIFVLACDYPFVSPELIQLLARKITDEFGAIVPEQHDGRLQPLCAFFQVAAAQPVVEEILRRSRMPRPMHEIVAQLNPRIVEFTEYSHLTVSETFFLNVNTGEDLERARGIV